MMLPRICEPLAPLPDTWLEQHWITNIKDVSGKSLVSDVVTGKSLVSDVVTGKSLVSDVVTGKSLVNDVVT